jgi:hypothetical protein
MQRITTVCLGLLLLTGVRAEPDKAPVKPEEAARALAAAREKGLDWLAKHQQANGSWGKTYTIAVTSFACLSYLSATDEPFTGDRGKVLLKGLNYLMANQKDGQFAAQGHSWIHGQGFGTLALSEAYGRSLLCKTKPDMDMKKVRTAVAGAVKVIEKNQSTSGGWWYTPGSPGQHEGSTTVCAVQAIVSGSNYGIDIDRKVLDNGFAYLKKCQTAAGGFNYQLGDGQNMKEGTAAGMATLGLMKKFDNQVMIKAHEFLQKLTPAGISVERFPYYGHFYGCMGMLLLGKEFEDDKTFKEKTAAYIAGAQKDLISWQLADGSWPLKSWVKDSNVENPSYATAYATLALFVPEARLSIYNRTPPELPKDTK